MTPIDNLYSNSDLSCKWVVIRVTIENDRNNVAV